MKKKPASAPGRNARPSVFDPFNNRLARDIRNTLSQAFTEALMKFDKSEFQNAARKWLAGTIDGVYADYVKDRLERYRQAFEQIKANRINDPKIQAVVIWNHGLFFEVHDHLEHLWQQTAGDERLAFKGLIQAAGVYVHLELSRRQAAGRLAVKSADLIQKYADYLSFIGNLNLLTDKLHKLDSVPPLLESSGFRRDRLE